jgi:hypothetical protein
VPDSRSHAAAPGAGTAAEARRGSDPRFHRLELRGQLNNIGLTVASALAHGGFNIWGNSFPAGNLPPPGSTSAVGGVPFLFPAPDPGGADNLRCRAQRLPIPAGRWDWLHVLGAAERRTEDLLLIEYADGTVRQQWLRISDFWPETDPRFGELLAFRCRCMHYPHHVQDTMTPAIWAQRVPVAVAAGATAVVLPDNPALHIFAITLQAAR